MYNLKQIELNRAGARRCFQECFSKLEKEENPGKREILELRIESTLIFIQLALSSLKKFRQDSYLAGLNDEMKEYSEQWKKYKISQLSCTK